MSLPHTEPHDASIIFTDAAANKVAHLLAEEPDPDQYLRVYITGGGCSGFQYGFTFSKTRNEDDNAVSKKAIDGTEVTLLIDSMSYTLLQGAEIDYVESMTGSQFVIKNPLAKSTCGCGSSFSIDDE